MWQGMSTAPKRGYILVRQSRWNRRGYDYHIVRWWAGEWVVSNGQDEEALLGAEPSEWIHFPK